MRVRETERECKTVRARELERESERVRELERVRQQESKRERESERGPQQLPENLLTVGDEPVFTWLAYRAGTSLLYMLSKQNLHTVSS